MSTVSAGLVQTTNLTVTGTQSGAVSATNFNTQNVNTGTVTLTGKLICSSNNVVQTLVKGVPVTTDNSVFADMLATTQNGRIAIAKALNYGECEPVFNVNGYKPLLDAGYSGKGVLYGHFERALQFQVPPLRHIVNPQHIFSTASSSFDALQNSDMRINTELTPHVYGTCGMAVGFDLHAKLIDGMYRQVLYGNYNIVNNDGFVMGAAYNADVVSIEQFYSDPLMYADNPGLLDFFDDVWVEVMEKAFLRGVKVGQAATIFINNEGGGYYMFDASGESFTGINNPLSYIASLAADHDMVYCESAGNALITLGPYGSAVPSPGSGYMGYSSDARNILSVGTKLINDGTVYPYVGGYLETGDIVSVDNYVVDKDYAQLNSYRNPDNGRYSAKPKTGYTERVNVSYHGFGRTVDTAGPGQNHRCKPDIISAQGSDHHYISWPAQTTGLKWVYAKLMNPATSGASPTLASGVCLLREALPLYDAHQIRECIMLSASNSDLSDADTDVGLGYGLINLEAALAYGQARPQKAPPSFIKGSWTYGSAFLANIAAGALDTLNAYQPFNGGNDFTPKSVQSFKCPKDDSLSANTDYQTAYDAYETAYNAYVASAPQLWTAGVLDLSPPKGLWGTSSTRNMSVDGPIFSVTSNRSWIAVSDEDMQEIKDLMIANGIKICTTSKILGAFSVLAESPEQLAAVVNGNSKILHVTPVKKLRIISGFDDSE